MLLLVLSAVHGSVTHGLLLVRLNVITSKTILLFMIVVTLEATSSSAPSSTAPLTSSTSLLTLTERLTLVILPSAPASV